MMACSTHVWVDLDAEGICHRRDPTHLGNPAAVHYVRLHDVVDAVCEIPASVRIRHSLRLGKTCCALVISDQQPKTKLHVSWTEQLTAQTRNACASFHRRRSQVLAARVGSPHMQFDLGH